MTLRHEIRALPVATAAGASLIRQAIRFSILCALAALGIGFSAPVQVTAQAQSDAGQPGITLPVLAADATTTSLHTHIASIVIDADATGAPVVQLQAAYDIRNEGKEAVEVQLRLPRAAEFYTTLSVDDVPIALQSTETGDGVATVSVPANGRVDVTLDAGRELGASLVFALTYPLSEVRAWPGQHSTRVDLQPGAVLDAGGWLKVEPDGWHYSDGADASTELQWLFEGSMPDSIEFHALNPATWLEIQQLEGSAGSPAGYAALGRRYGEVADGARSLGWTAVADRFFGQAVAAYTEGLRTAEVNNAPPQETAGLHAGLATLYRSRVAGADGSTDPAYAELMVAEAAQAMPGIMVDDPLRAELERWQEEGLRLMLADMRRRGDIPAALALIERLQALPAGAANAEFLAQERDALVVQQAVQLVEQGDRTTALSLAGEIINAPDLQPAIEYRSLFTRWTISTTIADSGIAIDAMALAAPGRATEAEAALDDLAKGWQESPQTRAAQAQFTRSETAAGDTAFSLRLTLPAGASGVEFAQLTPPRPDWSLLRTLLAQLGPQVTTAAKGLWQEMQVSQPIDLRAAGDPWQSIAADLERQAAGFEASATQTTGGSTATMEASQRARLQAANYRYAAQEWRDLARDSQVVIGLSTPGALTDAARAWLVTVASPPQMLDVRVETLSAARVLAAAAVALGGLLALAAVLWRLL